jgi:hypothetical protein
VDELVVQIGVKHGRVAELARSRGGKLSIGRGYGTPDALLGGVYLQAREDLPRLVLGLQRGLCRRGEDGVEESL